MPTRSTLRLSRQQRESQRREARSLKDIIDENPLRTRGAGAFKERCQELVKTDEDLSQVLSVPITRSAVESATALQSFIGADGLLSLDAVGADLELWDLINREPHKYEKVDWRKVMFMRFGKHVLQRDRSEPSLLRWRQLASMFKCQPSWLTKHCSSQLNLAFAGTDVGTIDLREQEAAELSQQRLPQALMKFVTHQTLLQDQCHLSIGQRCSDIKRRFKLDLRPHWLKRVYRILKAKQKKIKLKSPLSRPHLQTRRDTEVRNLKFGFQYVRAKKIPLYFLDECCFSSKHFKKSAWSNEHENVEIYFQRTPPAVAVSGIMDEQGLFMYITRQKSIKKEDHWQFLRAFRRKLGHKREVALFFDGLSFHRSKKTKEILKELNILGLLNRAYSSPLNPIEQVWKEAKYHYCRKLLKFLSEHEGDELDLAAMVEECLNIPLQMDPKAMIAKKVKEIGQMVVEHRFST